MGLMGLSKGTIMKLKPGTLFLLTFTICVLLYLALVSVGQVQSQPDGITPTVIRLSIPYETYNNRLPFVVPEWEATLWAAGEYRLIEVQLAQPEAQIIDMSIPPGWFINQITWTPSPTIEATPTAFMTNTPPPQSPTPNCAFEYEGVRILAWCGSPEP